MLAEVSLRAEVPVLAVSMQDEVASDAGPKPISGHGCSDAKFWPLITEVLLDSAFEGSQCSTEVEVDSVFKGSQRSVGEASWSSLCTGFTELELTLGGSPVLGRLISKSFNDSITASMNI